MWAKISASARVVTGDSKILAPRHVVIKHPRDLRRYTIGDISTHSLKQRPRRQKMIAPYLVAVIEHPHRLALHLFHESRIFILRLPSLDQLLAKIGWQNIGNQQDWRMLHDIVRRFAIQPR